MSIGDNNDKTVLNLMPPADSEAGNHGKTFNSKPD